jgi:hypothetical protein
MLKNDRYIAVRSKKSSSMRKLKEILHGKLVKFHLK